MDRERNGTAILDQSDQPADSVLSPRSSGVASADSAIGSIARVGATAPSEAFLRLIQHDFARRHLILSEGERSGTEHLVVGEGTSRSAVFNVGVRLGRPVAARIGDGETIAAAIDRVYSEARNTTAAGERARSSRDDDPVELAVPDSEQADVQAALRSAEADLLNTSGKAPMVRLVDLLLFEALQRSASDIHIQPVNDRVIIRYRLDGVLHAVREMPAAALPAIVSRVKVMARLDVAEQRAPQDGRATVTLGRGQSRRVDLRISTLPTTYGERVVIRILDTARSTGLLRFAALGMPPEVERRYLAQSSRTSGIVLVTGPTGSGKTTTLYTTLAWITQSTGVPNASISPSSACPLNIMTIEDPVEYDLATAGLAISQTQLNAKKGVTFAAGLRHILRQDPDVIMVGEVRDEETARIAVQASLTGHLVLSTLHTNDAPSAVARLLDLGVEPFLVSSSLAAVLAQRLVRTLHIDCAGAGCPVCLGTGYKGRTGLFELLVLDQPLREEVARRTSAQVIRTLAIGRGMTTLVEAGRALIAEGRTTDAEVARVIEGME